MGRLIYYAKRVIDIGDSASVKDAKFDPDYETLCLGYVGRMFDRMIIALCEQWAEAEESELVEELRGSNRAMSREKDRYLTIFEGVPNPVIIIDKDKKIADLNLAASVMLQAADSQGAHYYIKTVELARSKGGELMGMTSAVFSSVNPLVRSFLGLQVISMDS